jgi:hypothetical protein
VPLGRKKEFVVFHEDRLAAVVRRSRRLQEVLFQIGPVVEFKICNFNFAIVS